MARVEDVRYDFVLAELDGAAAREIVRRPGLTANAPVLDVELVSGRRYVWTVRARCALDGRTFVTPWSGSTHEDREGWLPEREVSIARFGLGIEAR
jgi:hypothetical protein